MPITIQKQKIEPPKEKLVEGSVVVPKEMTLEQLADSYGSLNDQIDALMQNPIFAKFAMVKEELNTRLAAEMEPQDEAELVGTHWLLEISACSKNSRKIKDIGKIAKFLGAETFAKLASIKLSDADKYLTPAQLDEVIDSDTGYGSSRKISPKFIG